MRLLGAQPLPRLSGEGALASFTRYYGCERGASAVEVPHYAGIRYHEIYPGVDLLWHSREARLEYEFRLAAGADPTLLQIGFAGGNDIAIDGNGDLVVTGSSGELRYRRPEAWQEIEGRRVAVEAGFLLQSGVISFEVGSYDTARPLRIDPVLEFSTYLGASGFDTAYAVGRDSAGNVYTTGETASFDFPGSGGGVGMRSNRAVFVTKLSANGSQVLFTTILASTGNDSGRGLALDGAGNIWITGIAGASNFPTTTNALNRASNGGQDAFVAKLDSSGRLSYATYLGGSGTDAAMGIAVDTSGIYVTGYTASTNFPVTPGVPQGTFQGGFYDVFLLKLDPTGTTLAYSTYLGGTGSDTAAAISVDAKGDACIAGQTTSPSLPTHNAIQSSYGGNGDILLSCLNPGGTAWNFLTYLGGSGPDMANAIALDTAGNIYLTGATYSPNFPVSSNAYQTTSRGGYDAFAMKLNATGTAIVFSTLLGGTASDAGTAIAVASSGTIWIVGYTASADFPTTVLPKFGGYFDGFVAQLSSDGASVALASYLGGSGEDRCLAVALSAAGEPIIVGMTGSIDFPTTSGVVQSAPPAPYNAFVSLLKLPGPTVVSVSPSSGSGTNSTFTFVLSDPNGASDVASVLVLINTALNGSNACYIQVDVVHNLVWMTDDAAMTWGNGIVLGSAATLQNSQCKVNGAASNLLRSGNILTLNLALSFQPGFKGAKTVYGYVSTIAGSNSGWTILGTWTIPNPQPTISVVPSSGSGSAGTFSFVSSDPNGASDLASVLVLINTALNGSNACYIQVDVVHNLVWMTDDAAMTWGNGIVLGSAATLQNSQCKVNGAASNLLRSGNILTLNLALSFQPGFKGAKTVYGYVSTIAGSNSGWTILGTWTIPNPQPTISVVPSSGSGSAGTFSFVSSDPNGASDLASVLVLINTALNGSNACYIQVDVVHNLVWMTDDAAMTWGNGIVLGSAATLQNNQCKVNGAASNLMRSGNILTLNLALSFQPGFKGAKTVYGYAQTLSGLVSGWQTPGVWTIQ